MLIKINQSYAYVSVICQSSIVHELLSTTVHHSSTVVANLNGHKPLVITTLMPRIPAMCPGHPSLQMLCTHVRYFVYMPPHNPACSWACALRSPLLHWLGILLDTRHSYRSTRAFWHDWHQHFLQPAVFSVWPFPISDSDVQSGHFMKTLKDLTTIP